MTRPALRLALGLSLCLAWLVPVADRLATPWVVVGESMAPTLLDGERVLVDRWTFAQRAPRPGEVALVALGDGRLLIKRIGRPVGTRAGVWVYGDNRGSSDDSRRFGPVPPEAVRGRVVARYWPPWRASLVRSAGPPPDSRPFIDFPGD